MSNRRTGGGYSRSGYSRSSHSRGRVGARSLKRRGARSFFRRNAKIIAVAGIILVVAAICVTLFLGGGKETVAQVSPEAEPSEALSATPVPTIDLSEFTDEYSYEGIDEGVLAGLEGSDDSLFTDEEDEEIITSGITIGITLGSVKSENDKLLLGKLEQATGDAVKKGLVYRVYCYDAHGDYNQQLQDMRSLIKNEVDVIIAGATDEESFKMVSFMAKQEGIPLIAYDAPVDSGYTVNVVSNQTSWGEKYGRFMADNLSSGSVVQVLGSETSDVDAERKAAIEARLRSNSALNVSAAYASWNKDKANEAIDALLDKDEKIDGVITAEGMAEGALDAFIDAGALPKVMCGDTSAGFIKKWYALKNGGVVMVPPASGKRSPPPAKFFSAKAGEFIACAQPSPARSAAIAFEIALKLAEGRTLISEGVKYEYSANTFITDKNLSYYYEMVKDMPDSFMINDPVDAAAAESLFKPE